MLNGYATWGRRSGGQLTPGVRSHGRKQTHANLSKPLPCTNCTHTRGFVPRVRLRAIFEVAVRSSRAVDTDIASCGDVRTSVGLGHHGDDSYSGRSTDRLGAQPEGLTVHNPYCLQYTIRIGYRCGVDVEDWKLSMRTAMAIRNTVLTVLAGILHASLHILDEVVLVVLGP